MKEIFKKQQKKNKQRQKRARGTEGLSLKRGFDWCGHGFDGCDGLGALCGFDGLGGFGGFDGFDGFSRFGSLKGFSVSFTLLLKVLSLLVSYPVSYTWLKGEPQISAKQRYLQYVYYVLTVWSTWWLFILVFSVNVHHYIQINIYESSES